MKMMNQNQKYFNNHYYYFNNNSKNTNIYITIYMYIQDQMYSINVQKVLRNDCLCLSQNYREGGSLS